MNNKDVIRLGIVGCGAIAKNYLKILPKKNVSLVSVVDSDEATAKDAKERYHFLMYCLDYREILRLVDAVIVCLPNFLHAPSTIEFLQQGVSVLCEKPMAINEEEGKMMIGAADRSRRVLCAANLTRFYWSSQEIKRIISTKSMGEVLSIDAEQGGIFSWPTKSGFFFDKKRAGGGVLIDIGSHLLDLILWWLGCYPDYLSYTDDAFGGVEADAEIKMSFPGNVQVSAKVSRIRNLDNCFTIALEGGTIIASPYEYNSLSVVHENGAKKVIQGPKRCSFEDYFEKMINDFLASVSGKKEPFINPADVLPSIKLVQQCYASAQHFEFPWL